MQALGSHLYSVCCLLLGSQWSSLHDGGPGLGSPTGCPVPAHASQTNILRSNPSGEVDEVLQERQRQKDTEKERDREGRGEEKENGGQGARSSH